MGFIPDFPTPPAGLTAAEQQALDFIVQNGARFRGEYSLVTIYKQGDYVTHNNSLWRSKIDENLGSEPDGYGDDVWALEVYGAYIGKSVGSS